MTAFTHVTVGTNDLEKARAFYDNILGKIGLQRLADLGDNGSIWGKGSPSFFVLKPANGEPATVGNGVTVSFEAPDRASIHAFYDSALTEGAEDEGAAGPRGWAPMRTQPMYVIWMETNWLSTASNRSNASSQAKAGLYDLLVI